MKDAGVATGAVVGRSAGGGDAAASVGDRVGLGSVANCGPASSSAQATSSEDAPSAAKYARQLLRERVISTSQVIAQVHPIARVRGRRVGDRRRKSEATAACITRVPGEAEQAAGQFGGLATRAVYNRCATTLRAHHS